ncbi:MAG: hypothetical protein NTV51_00740 [Verrucomicrobia bacterium]|nr:hypothetical protein [Verrucomicrobiota bacterium]
MKPNPFAVISAGILVLVSLVGSVGCSTIGGNGHRSAGGASFPKGTPTYALAVAVHGGVKPTAAQWNAMYDKFYRVLAARGYLLINDYTIADNIINVDFLPDPLNPDVGTALVSSIVPNTIAYKQTAALARASYSSSTSAYSGYGTDPFSNSYYGYDRNSTYDYASSGSGYTTPPSNTGKGTTVPPGTTPPHHHARPTNPVDCPPGTTPYLPPPSYVGIPPRGGSSGGGYAPPSSYSPRPGSDSGSSYSSPSSSSGRSYAASSDSGSSRYSGSSSSGSSGSWSSRHADSSSNYSGNSGSGSSSSGHSGSWHSDRSGSSSGSSGSSYSGHSGSSSSGYSGASSSTYSGSSSSSYSGSSGSSSSYSAPSSSSSSSSSGSSSSGSSSSGGSGGGNSRTAAN